MIPSLYRRPAAALDAAPVFDPIDPLSGAVPTWRLDEEPIYLEVVRDLGRPGQLLGPAPGDVVEGVVLDPEPVEDDDRVVEDDGEDEHPRAVEAPPTVPIPIRPTTRIPVSGRGGRKRRQPNARRAAS